MIRDATALALEVAVRALLAPSVLATRWLVPPALPSVSSFGRTYRHLVFAGEYEPHRGEPGGERWHARTANRSAHAWLLQHPGPPRPWLVCLHGYRTGSPLTGFFQFSPRW